jgi:enoyl-CoA hydratase/carnithine racemase
VARVTRGSASGRTVGKHTFYAQVDLEQRQAYDLAVEVMAAAALTPDAQEGIAAFLQKRRPTFVGLP